MDAADEARVAKALVEQVGRALLRAGLPVLDGDEYCGAKVELAHDAEVPAGVVVRWNPSLELVDLVVGQMQGGTYDAPEVSESGLVRAAMQPALIGVLRLAGMNAREYTDETRFSQVIVEPEHWGRHSKQG